MSRSAKRFTRKFTDLVFSSGKRLSRRSRRRMKRSVVRRLGHEPLEHRVLLDGAGPHIIGASPDPVFDLRVSTFDAVEVTFHEPINEATFTVDDVAITGPGGSIAPTGITSLGGNQYKISFPAQPERGTYNVLVGPEIEDAAGNPMDQDGDGITGEADEDVFALSVGAYDADTVFTASQAIAAGDATYDGQDICIIGATLTIDGPHTFNTVHLIEGATVTHTAVSTSGLDLTVNDDVIVDASSRITADGRGFQGDVMTMGQGPGAGGTHAYDGGGGGYGGAGGRGVYAAAGGVYGSAMEPIGLGSSGGAASLVNHWSLGGDGGGAIRLMVSDTLTLDGTITANRTTGDGWRAGGGSGGSIWVNTDVLAGSGAFHADGGAGLTWADGGGGGGRIAVYYRDDTGFVNHAISTANGGTGGAPGEAGTVGFIDQTASSGHLHVYTTFAVNPNGSIWGTAGRLTGSGEFHANGGAGRTWADGGGGGGRVCVYVGIDDFSGSISVLGGWGGNQSGAAGTQCLTVDPDLNPNQPPVADAGGPYVVKLNGSVQLDASGTTDPDQCSCTLSYQWDLDGDGVYGETGAAAPRGDEVGTTPTFLAVGPDLVSPVTVSLRVTDDGGLFDDATAIIEIQGAIWHVDDDAANDPGPGDPAVSDPLEDGSPNHPFDTIQEGIDAATDGDTVLIAAGTYPGDIAVITKSIDLIGAGPQDTIVDATGIGGGILRLTAGNSTVEGLAIVNASDVAIEITGGSGNVITNVDVSWTGTGQSGRGIVVGGGSTNNVIRKVWVNNRRTAMVIYDDNQIQISEVDFSGSFDGLEFHNMHGLSLAGPIGTAEQPARQHLHAGFLRQHRGRSVRLRRRRTLARRRRGNDRRFRKCHVQRRTGGSERRGRIPQRHGHRPGWQYLGVFGGGGSRNIELTAAGAGRRSGHQRRHAAVD